MVSLSSRFFLVMMASAITINFLGTVEARKCSNLRGNESSYWQKSTNESKKHHYEFALHDCELQRFTHKEAKQCLASRHIILIGDSIVRLQYLSLIYFLIHGEYPDPYGKDLPGGIPNVAQHKAYKTWEETMLGLSESVFKGYESCDCYRDGQWRNIKNISENRFFKMSPNDGVSEGTIKVSFFFDTCMGNIFGHYPLPPSLSRPWRYDAPDWKGQWKDLPSQWKQNNQQGIEADAVFTSCGHWPFLAGSGHDGWTEKDYSTVSSTMKAFQSMLKTNPTRPFPSDKPNVIWRTNFPSQQVFKRKGRIDKVLNNMKSYDTALNVANELNFRVIDTNDMVAKLNHTELPPMKYIFDKTNPCPMIRGGDSGSPRAEALWHNGDGTHPCPWMSEEINNYLLNILCL
jgi:hypothetical protein